ncbi:DNA replication licensing factor MCM4-like [Aphis craccivora]|uniref:DNA replication licensing factor MCM4-like n=1 Tax=Aphis craccivora TaxID=307492 RepID=A0A6G0YX05_APHCR|nr:DNA replication licensing factor MCM4-like [Aphis craccivora]
MSMDILSNMNNQELSQPSPLSKSNNTKTFAETTANTTFPKKEQAIILNTINEIPQIEYVKAFSKISSPKNIIFASRISNNRFCIYFRDKHTVDELIQNYSLISVNENQIPFRRLVNPAKRFIISNAHPIIPHEVITEHLLLENIKTLSPITFLKAGFQDELAHISSFRRQVYIHPDDIANVPGSLLIKYDNTDFRIFLTDDTLTCYLCKQSGHTSNHCKKEPNISTTNKYNTQKPTADETHITIPNATHEEDKT